MNDEQITAYVLDALSPTERAAFEACMRQDPELRAQVEEMRSFCDLLEKELAPPAPTDTLTTEQRFTLFQAFANRPGTTSKARTWRKPGVALALLAACVTLLLVVRPAILENSEPQANAPVPAASSTKEDVAEAPRAEKHLHRSSLNKDLAGAPSKTESDAPAPFATPSPAPGRADAPAPIAVTSPTPASEDTPAPKSQLALNSEASTFGGTLTDHISFSKAVAEDTAKKVIQGSSEALALTKSGAGTLELQGANSYTGGIIVGAGVLSLGGDGINGTVSSINPTTKIIGVVGTPSSEDNAAYDMNGQLTATANPDLASMDGLTTAGRSGGTALAPATGEISFWMVLQRPEWISQEDNSVAYQRSLSFTTVSTHDSVVDRLSMSSSGKNEEELWLFESVIHPNGPLPRTPLHSVEYQPVGVIPTPQFRAIPMLTWGVSPTLPTSNRNEFGARITPPVTSDLALNNLNFQSLDQEGFSTMSTHSFDHGSYAGYLSINGGTSLLIGTGSSRASISNNFSDFTFNNSSLGDVPDVIDTMSCAGTGNVVQSSGSVTIGTTGNLTVGGVVTGVEINANTYAISLNGGLLQLNSDISKSSSGVPVGNTSGSLTQNSTSTISSSAGEPPSTISALGMSLSDQLSRKRYLEEKQSLPGASHELPPKVVSSALKDSSRAEHPAALASAVPASPAPMSTPAASAVAAPVPTPTPPLAITAADSSTTTMDSGNVISRANRRAGLADTTSLDRAPAEARSDYAFLYLGATVPVGETVPVGGTPMGGGLRSGSAVISPETINGFIADNRDKAMNTPAPTKSKKLVEHETIKARQALQGPSFFLSAQTHPLSLVPLKSEPGAYTVVRQAIQQGHLPQATDVLLGSLIDQAPYDKATLSHSSDHRVQAQIEVTEAPWNPQHHLACATVALQIEPSSAAQESAAKDVQAKIEFHSDVVRSYRLLSSTAPMPVAGSIPPPQLTSLSTGHVSTLLYEYEPSVPAPATNSAAITLAVHYHLPSDPQEHTETATATDTPRKLGESAPHVQLAVAMAEFGLLLQKAPEAKHLDWDQLLRLAAPRLTAAPNPEYPDLLQVIEKAKTLSQEEAKSEPAKP